MKNEELLQVRDHMIAYIKRIMGIKGKEYQRDDALSNFKRAGATMKCAPEFSLIGYMMKHVVSILDMVDDLDDNNVIAAPEVWDEKIGDIMAYLILLRALVAERRGSLE